MNITDIIIPEGMTKAQEQTIRKVMREIPRFDFYSSEGYEVKDFDITVTDFGKVFISFHTGMVGDEGTLASVICRKWRHFMIGERGGVSVFTQKGNRKRVSVFTLMNECYEH